MGWLHLPSYIVLPEFSDLPCSVIQSAQLSSSIPTALPVGIFAGSQPQPIRIQAILPTGPNNECLRLVAKEAEKEGRLKVLVGSMRWTRRSRYFEQPPEYIIQYTDSSSLQHAIASRGGHAASKAGQRKGRPRGSQGTSAMEGTPSSSAPGFNESATS